MLTRFVQGAGIETDAMSCPSVEEPPPIPPASAGGGSPTADSWEAEADDSLLSPDQDPDEDVGEVYFRCTPYLFFKCRYYTPFYLFTGGR